MMTAWKAKAKAAVRAGRECRARRAPRAARRLAVYAGGREISN